MPTNYERVNKVTKATCTTDLMSIFNNPMHVYFLIIEIVLFKIYIWKVWVIKKYMIEYWLITGSIMRFRLEYSTFNFNIKI